MSSSTVISNMALSHLGLGKTIANLDTEQSEEASACRVYYETARDTVLRDAQWPFAKTDVALGLVEECPTDEWNYSYRYPSDCLFVRRIISGIKRESREIRVPYQVSSDASGLLILTDVADAKIEYTKRAEQVQFYPSDFLLAFSYLLAALIAPRITKGDSFKLKNEMYALYTSQVSNAKKNGFNEQKDPTKPQSEFITTRDSDDYDKYAIDRSG